MRSGIGILNSPESYYSTRTSIVTCVFCWSMFYFCVRYCFPEKSPEWCSRAVTLIHGIGSAYNGLTECIHEGNGMFEHARDIQTNNQQVTIVVSLGYFIFDLVWCLVYQNESKLMLVHHIFSVGALYRMLAKNNAGAQTVCAIGGMEVTNPFLQIRWFLRTEGFQLSFYFTLVEMFFILFFFMMRVGFGTYFFYNVTFRYNNDWEFIFLATTLYIISILFVANIIQYLYNKNSRKNRSTIHK